MYIGLYTVYARLGQRGSRGRPQGVRRHTLRLGTRSGIVITIPEALVHSVRRGHTAKGGISWRTPSAAHS